MESQSGARTPLVDPFGRELEEWLRDAPATRSPYVSDLVVPPVTGPVQRPDATTDAAPERDHGTAESEAAPSEDTAFRRPRDRGRHATVCAPSFPEPPERLALRIEELEVEVSAQSGRPVIERIVILEDEIRRRDEDLARLSAWEATVADLVDPEAEAARAYARSVFADLLADAADETDRRARAAARRSAATGALAVVVQLPAPTPELVEPAAAPVTADRVDDLDVESPEGDEPARPVLSLPAVSPVSANTRPTPLVQPATGPTVVDRDAFRAVLLAHRAETVGVHDTTPVEHPAELVTGSSAVESSTGTADGSAVAAEPTAQPGWWARVVAALRRLVRR